MPENPPEFLGFAATLLESQASIRQEIKSNWPSLLGDLYPAREYCLAAIGSVLARPDKAVQESEVAQKVRRTTIHSAVTQGIYAIDCCLSAGLYAQASALIRQEFEAVDGLRGIRQGKQKDKTTSQIKALRHLGRVYSQLTGLAHLSDHQILAHAVSEEVGSFDPRLNPELCRFLFSVHVNSLVGICLDMAELRPFDDQTPLSSEEHYHLGCAMDVLVKSGFITLKEQSSA